MPSGSESSGSSPSSGSSGNPNGGYNITGDKGGDHRQGNHWDSRDYGSGAPNQNSYHYSNRDGSYYYSNADGSTYHNDGHGGSTYKR